MINTKDEKIILERIDHLDDWMILEDGSILLLEVTIAKFQNIKIYVNSNEMSSHNRPHVHVNINDKSYEISIDNTFDVLAPKEDKYDRYVIKSYMDNILNDCRKAWNEIHSNYKFAVDASGNYICR